VGKRGLQGCLKTGERLLGIRFTGKGGLAQPLEGSNFLSTLLAPLRIDSALGLGLAMFRVEEDPALRYPAITRGHHRTYTAVVRNGGYKQYYHLFRASDSLSKKMAIRPAHEPSMVREAWL
jgi:hypothetical protein